jgi:methylenetetrahydrofolate reductase (NADPH)
MRVPFGRPAVEAAPLSAAARRLVGRTRYELVPMRGVEDAVADLPCGALVSVTCSPVRGLPATLDLAARLIDAGHDVVPHVAARMVEGPAEARRLARWVRDHGVTELFVIAGDAEHPHGAYAGGVPLLADLLELDTGLLRIGVPSYPDGHPFIDPGELRGALHQKQVMLAAAGLGGSTTTQMCLDPERIERWLMEERERGLQLPVELGVPGVVDRVKLMTMGVRLGVGASLRFLRHQRATMRALLGSGGYDPTDLVVDLAEHADRLGIRGLHSFTFNRVDATREWQEHVLGG